LFKAQFRAAAPRARHVPPSGITPVVTPSFQFGGLTRILQRDVVPAKRIPQARVRRNNNTPRDIQRSNLRENANSLSLSLSLSLSNVFRIEREVTRAPFAIFRAFRFHRDAARRTFIVHAAENHVAPPHARYTHTHTYTHAEHVCARLYSPRVPRARILAQQRRGGAALLRHWTRDIKYLAHPAFRAAIFAGTFRSRRGPARRGRMAGARLVSFPIVPFRSVPFGLPA